MRMWKMGRRLRLWGERAIPLLKKTNYMPSKYSQPASQKGNVPAASNLPVKTEITLSEVEPVRL
jgi:hypothetical protein